MQSPSSEKFLASYALRWDSVAVGFEMIESRRISLPASDLGVMHGAILVERARTFGKKIIDLSPHKKRLQAGFETLGIDGRTFLNQLDSSIDELIAKSPTLLNEQSDASLCIVATPGDYYSGHGLQGFVHWLPIPWDKLATWYQQGTTLVRVHYASGAGECWPSNIKTRSRLNYYLAEQDAHKRFPSGLALLCTSRGMIADTSVANLLLVDQRGRISAPRKEDVVQGTSLARVEKMIEAQGKSIQFRDVLYEELYDAAEVLLVGNTGCLWHASHLQRRQIADGNPGPLCLSLQKQWCESIGFDWKTQAILRGRKTNS